jgi:hypothetical protein
MKSIKKQKGYTLVDTALMACIGVMFMGTGIVVASPESIVAAKVETTTASQNTLADVCKEAHLTTCYQ